MTKYRAYYIYILYINQSWIWKYESSDVWSEISKRFQVILLSPFCSLVLGNCGSTAPSYKFYIDQEPESISLISRNYILLLLVLGSHVQIPGFCLTSINVKLHSKCRTLATGTATWADILKRGGHNRACAMRGVLGSFQRERVWLPDASVLNTRNLIEFDAS